jgi:drug/metabolite transporter (DMT)-like permease
VAGAAVCIVSSVRRGPLYITLSGVVFTIMVSLVKLAREELDALEVMFWRGVVAVPIAGLMARKVGLRLHNLRLFAVRALTGFAGMGGYFVAAKGLAVANLTLISLLRPMFIAILAPLTLGAAERAGPVVWLLLCAGLAGCALILAPDLAVGSSYGLWALGATVASSAAHVCVRGLARTDDSRVIVFHFQACVMVMAAAVLVAESHGLPGLPDAHLWPYLVGIGLTATAGQLLMTQAYAEDRASVVAAASYSSPIWGVFADLVVFAIDPSWHTIVGGGIIVATGTYLLFGRRVTPPPELPESLS